MHRLLVGILALIAHVSTLQNGAAQKIAIPKLPVPSGSFGIGRVAYYWIDLSRADGESRQSRCTARANGLSLVSRTEQ